MVGTAIVDTIYIILPDLTSGGVLDILSLIGTYISSKIDIYRF